MATALNALSSIGSVAVSRSLSVEAAPPVPEPEPEPEGDAARRKAAKAAWKVHRKHRRLPLGEQQALDRRGAPLPRPCWARDPAGRTESAAAAFAQVDVEGYSGGAEPPRTVRREVVCGDALGWLRDQQTLQGHVITSLPDIGELDSQALGSGDRLGTPPPPLSLCVCMCAHISFVGAGGYRKWFVGVVTLILERLAPRAVAVFYQSDGRHGGAWLDKSCLLRDTTI
jgi:hypothetical protein